MLGRLVRLWMVTLIALPSAASAQVIVGFGSGLSVGSVSANDGEDPDVFEDSRTGLRIGAFVGIPVSDVFSFEPGLAFVQKGGKDAEEGDEVTLRLDYIQVSGLGVFHIPTGGSVGIHLFAGPTLSVEVGCGFTGKGPGLQQLGLQGDFDCDHEDVELKTQSADWGGTIGGALSLDLNETKALFLSAFYNLGFTDVLLDSGTDSLKNRVFGIEVGAVFAVGG